MAGYPTRGNPIFGLAIETGQREPEKAKDGMPYTVLGYANGPGGERINGTRQNLTRVDTGDENFLQQSTVWLSSETHGGEDVGKFYNIRMCTYLRKVQWKEILYFFLREGWVDGWRSNCSF